ncbi:hypothetical protein NKG94_28060 [Micromonospora sp. M12]
MTATRRTASIAAPVLLTVAFAVLVSGWCAPPPPRTRQGGRTP